MTIDTAGLRELIWQVENLGEHKAEAEPILRHWEQWLPALLDRVQVLEKALGKYDAAMATCPFNAPRKKLPPGDKPCAKCGATSSDICRAMSVAAHVFVAEARQSLPTKDVG